MVKYVSPPVNLKNASTKFDDDAIKLIVEDGVGFNPNSSYCITYESANKLTFLPAPAAIVQGPVPGGPSAELPDISDVCDVSELHVSPIYCTKSLG